LLIGKIQLWMTDVLSNGSSSNTLPVMNTIFLVSILLIPAFFSVLRLAPRFRWLSVSLSFAIISSLRPEVGMDFEAYARVANQDNSFVDLMFWYREPLSAGFVRVGQLVSLELMLFMFAFCYALGIFVPLLFLSKKSFLLYFFALYCLPMGFMFSFDGIRQAGAVGLLMLFLASGSRTLVLVVICAHLSALFVLAIFYFAKIKQKITIGVLIGLMMSIAALYLELFFGLIWKYNSTGASNFGGKSILLLGCIGLLAALLPKIITLKNGAHTASNLVMYGRYSGAILAGSSLAYFAPNMLVVRFLYFFVPLSLFCICSTIENSYLRGPLRACFFIAICGIAVLYWSNAGPHVVESVFG